MKQPIVRDGLLFLLSLAAVLFGAVVFVRDHDRDGLVMASFFSLGMLVGGASLVERTRMRASAGVSEIALAGGTTLTVRTGRIVMVALLLIVVGAIMSWASGGFGVPFRIAGVAIAGAGALVLVKQVTSRDAGQTVTFDVDGIRFGRSWGSVLLGWNNVAAVTVGELSSNPIVFIRVRDPQALVITTIASGPKAGPLVATEVQQNRAMFGYDLSIFTYLYGVDAVLLQRAIATYAENPARRAELVRRRAIG